MLQQTIPSYIQNIKETNRGIPPAEDVHPAFIQIIISVIIVRKGALALPFIQGTHPLTHLVPFLKSLFPLPSSLFHPILKYFRQFPQPSCNPLLPLSSKPTFFGSNKFKKCNFTSSTVTFYQRSIFNLLNPFTDRLY